MGRKTALLAALLIGAALALNTTSVVPTKASVFDAQNGMGLGNGIVYDGTQYVNASDNQYARTAGNSNNPTWVQANFSLSMPQGAKVLNAMFELEHQQDDENGITVNVSANNGTAWYWNVCSFPPLGVADSDRWNYCNVTQYVTYNVSLLRMYLNITYLGGTHRESIDLMRLNYTYVIPANLTGNVSMNLPQDNTAFNATYNFSITGAYNLSCLGETGECGQTNVYAEYCAGENCTDFTRITNATKVYAAGQNNVNCSYLLPGGNCSGTLNITAASQPGKYSLRIAARSYSNDLFTQPSSMIAYGLILTGWTPPYSAACYDPVGEGDIVNCLERVNRTDFNYAEMRYNPSYQPGWLNANFSFPLPAGAIIENVSMIITHKEGNPAVQNGTAFFWNGAAWQPICALRMGTADHSDICDLPFYYFQNASSLSNVRLRFEFNTSLGTSSEFVDFTGMRIQYRVPYVANFTGGVQLSAPPDRDIISPNADFNISGSYSLQCLGPPEGECGTTRVFAEYCFGEGCTDFGIVDATANVYSLGTSVVSCGFLNSGNNCSGNITIPTRANAGKYVMRLRASSYMGDIYSGTATVTFPGSAFTPCAPLYSAVCYTPNEQQQGQQGIYDCTSQVKNLDNVYAELRYDPSSQPAWMNANISMWLPRNSYILNVTNELTHRIETPGKQTGLELTWNVTGWSKVCDLSMLSYDHTDRCSLPLSIFQKASDLDNVRNRVEYYTTQGTRRAWIDYSCVRAQHRAPLLYLDRSEYFVGGVMNISGDYWVYGGPLNLSIYDGNGSLAFSRIVNTNGSGYFNYSWTIDNVTIKKDIDLFVINVTDVVEPWHNDWMTVGVRGCEAYVAEQYEPCSVQCPRYTNYTLSITTYEGDERIVSRFKVCHIA